MSSYGFEIFQVFVPQPHERAEISQLSPDFLARGFCHAPYYGSLCDVSRDTSRLLYEYVHGARVWGFNKLVLHPGSARTTVPEGKKQGIKTFARAINLVQAHRWGVRLFIENGAHGGATVGSVLSDFYELAQWVDEPRELRLCIDTAHAHAAGYYLKTVSGRAKFFDELETVHEKIPLGLLHFNDVYGAVGTHEDRHAPVGMGVLGHEALYACLSHKIMHMVPIILELSLAHEPMLRQTYALLKSWVTELYGKQ